MPLPFAGCSTRAGRLAWGQQGTWDVVQDWLPEVKPFFVLTRWLPVPPVLALDDVVELLAELLRRHEALRTVVRTTPSGEVVQVVQSAGELPITVLDRPADDPVTFADLVEECLRRAAATSFDFAEELPLRPYIATHEGIPVLIVFGVSHVSADYLSADLLVDELSSLVVARVAGQPLPAARAALQPLDLAAFEDSPEGQLHSLDAMDNLRKQLAATPRQVFSPRGEAMNPRFHRLELQSSALPSAVRTAARRYRTGTSALLLGVSAALIRHYADGPVWPVSIMQSNRAQVQTLQTVSSLNQVVYTALDVSSDSVAELIGQAAAAMTLTRRYGRYDGRTSREISRRQLTGPTPVQPGCQFNDMWSAVAKSRAAVRTAPELDELSATTTLQWPQKTQNEGQSIFIDVRGTADRMTFSFMADTELLPPADMERFARVLERVVLNLATRDVTSQEIAQLLGVASTSHPAPIGSPP